MAMEPDTSTIRLNELDTGTSEPSPLSTHDPNSTHDSNISRPEFSLPPVDRGRQAWLFLAACWVVEVLVFGFGFSFGVFQDYYSHHEPFKGSANIAVIGTTTLGTLYLGTPLVLVLCRYFPRAARWFTLAGLCTASLSMALSSFCTTVPQLIATQGFLFGLGGCFTSCSCAIYIDQWFAQRKGLAYGIVWSASGFGGAASPLVLETLLNNLGFRTTTRVWAAMLFAIAAPLAYLIKPRLPFSGSTHITPFRLQFYRTFVFYQLVNVIHATGYFIPGIYLPTFAHATFGTSNFLSTLTVIITNIATTIGLTTMGVLTDKVPVSICISVSALGSAIVVLALWGLSGSLPVLYIFCILYGVFGGSWTCTWPGLMKEMSQRSEGEGYVDAMVVYSCLCIGRGIGNIASGPLSEALISGMPWKGQAIGGYGSGYGPLIVYTGLTGILGGASFIWKRLDWI